MIDLDDSNQSTKHVYASYRLNFAGQGWWFTKEEKEHVELLQHYFPKTWEKLALRRINDGTIGSVDRDLSLQMRSQIDMTK